MADDIRSKLIIDGLDSSAQGLDKVAEAAEAANKQVDKLDGSSAKVKIEADDREAKRSIDDLMSKVDRLDGDSASILLAANAGQITADIGALLVKLDALDANDPKVDITIGEIASLKGDLDAIESKIEEINGTPVKVDATSAKSGLDDLGKSADSSKSVLANMVGNTTQDLGALGGVAGGAGVAIGQMGEYMADAAAAGDSFGQIAANFSKVLGPLALLSAGVSLATGVINELKAQQEAAAERTKAFGEAMDSSVNDVVGFSEVLRDNIDDLKNWTGATEGVNSAMDDFASSVGSKIPAAGKFFTDTSTDLIDVANRAGLSIYDLSKRIENGEETTVEFADAILEAKRNGSITREEFYALSDAMKQYGGEAEDASEKSEAIAAAMRVGAEEANALLQELIAQEHPLEQYTDKWSVLIGDMRDGTINTEVAADAINFLAEELGLTQTEVIALANAEKERTDATDDGTAATDAAADSTDSYSDALERSAQAHRDAAAAAQEQLDAAISAADAHLGAIKAQEDMAEATQNTIDVIKDQDSTLEDLKDAVDGERDAAIRSAQENQRWAEEMATASGTAQTAAEKVDLYNQSLMDSAQTATPAARQAIYEYLIDVNKIEPTKATEIRTLVDQGLLDEANRLIDDASADETLTIVADANTAAADEQMRLWRQRNARLNVAVRVTNGMTNTFDIGLEPSPPSRSAASLTTTTGELVDVAARAGEDPADQQYAVASRSASLVIQTPAAAPTNVTNIINVPRGYREIDAANALYRNQRRSGKLYANV